MASTLQKVFREHWPSYRRTHRLPLRAWKAAHALVTCRTAARGGHIKRCPHRHIEQVWYNSCRHRCCPMCAWRDRERWVAAQIARLPGCDYFHVIFTVSDEMNALWSHNRRAFTNLLMRAAWESLREMLADPKHLGALPGAVAGFHSWGQTLWMHPHAHFLVSAGGVDPEGRWRPCPRRGLLPARALSAKFRGKFRAWLLREIQNDRLALPPERSKQQWINLLNRLGRTKHHVMVMPRYEHGRGVIRYLGRYLKGGCVSDRRITPLPNGSIRLDYKDNLCDPPKSRAIELSPDEFLGRILGHVPETGQHVVRCYGLFATAKREALDSVRAQLGDLPLEDDPEQPRTHAATPSWAPPLPSCPVCGALLITTALAPNSRAPPRISTAA